jgi:hypothetical protein
MSRVVIDPGNAKGCWIWAGYVNRTTGYARFSYLGNSVDAHRVAYRKIKGVVPPKFDIDHLCRVRHCVNPDHMEAVAHAENLRRGWAAKRAKRAAEGAAG